MIPQENDVARIYSASLDSVALINKGKPTSMSEEEWADTVARNKEHLRICLKQLKDTTNFDLAPLRDVVERPDGAPLLKQAPRFVARDLLALLTPDDYNRVTSVVASNPAMGLLWSGLLAQGDAPIRVNSKRFVAGLDGLTAALGAARAAELFAALNIDVASLTTTT